MKGKIDKGGNLLKVPLECSECHQMTGGPA